MSTSTLEVCQHRSVGRSVGRSVDRSVGSSMKLPIVSKYSNKHFAVPYSTRMYQVAVIGTTQLKFMCVIGFHKETRQSWMYSHYEYEYCY